jgi:hypothetical protein
MQVSAMIIVKRKVADRVGFGSHEAVVPEHEMYGDGKEGRRSSALQLYEGR